MTASPPTRRVRFTRGPLGVIAADHRYRMIPDTVIEGDEGDLEWGPWMGVPPERQRLCAVIDCTDEGRPWACPTDGGHHHHGCVHYNLDWLNTGLTFRKGWGWLCDRHYDVVRRAVAGHRDR